MMKLRLISTGMLLAALVAGAAAQKKVDIVKVAGCLRLQGPDNWMLVAATEPEASSANAPLRTELPKEPPAGKNQFKLIGVGEFNLPLFKDHTVLVKALYIKAQPMGRLNITSVNDALPTCAADAPK
jgi:hypothetical protein